MHSIKIVSAVLSILIGVAAFIPYIRDIFLKQTKPHIYTWLIWSITQGVAVFGLWYGNGGPGSIELTIGTFLVFLIFLFSLRHGTKDITISDTIVFIIALFAIAAWKLLHNPALAIFMVSAIDAFGYIPSYRKIWKEPHSETVLSWTLFAFGNLFAILALTEYNALTLTYLITITTCNFILVFLCLLRRNRA